MTFVTATEHVHEVLTTEPQFWIINRLQPRSLWEDMVFSHKNVDYWGFASLFGDTPIIMRICILQPRVSGEVVVGHLPVPWMVFGGRMRTPGIDDPITVATPISEEGWIRISDVLYVNDGHDAGGGPGLRLDYKHRLTNNLSLQQPTVGAGCQVSVGPIFLCAYADLNEPEAHVSLDIFARTMGMMDTVVRESAL